MARIIGLFILLLVSIVSGFGNSRAQSNPAASPDTILATHDIEMVNFAFGEHNDVADTKWSAPSSPLQHFSFEPTVIEEEEQDDKNSSSKKNSRAQFAIDLALNHVFSLLQAQTSEGNSFHSLQLSRTAAHRRFLIIQVFRI